MINTMGGLDADPEVFLIDFGSAMRPNMLTKQAKNTSRNPLSEDTKVEGFTGNIIFASERHLDFGATSRLKSKRRSDFTLLYAYFYTK